MGFVMGYGYGYFGKIIQNWRDFMRIYIKDYPTNLIWFLGVSENEIYPWNGHFMGNMMNRRIFFCGYPFFAKNLSSHDPTYWFLALLNPAYDLLFRQSGLRDGCDSDTWPIWIRVGPKFCARLLQLPGIFRMWCWSPVSATAMVLSTLPESKTQMAQIATVRWKCWAKGEPLPWLRLKLGTCWGCTRHRRPTKKSCRIYGKMSLGWQTRGELFDHLSESEINFLATPK